MQITLIAKLIAFIALSIFATYMDAAITIGKGRKTNTFNN